MKSQTYFDRMILLFPDSFTFKRSLWAVRVCSVAECWSDATSRSEHLDNSPWPPPMSSQEFYPHVFTEQSWCEQTGGCGGLCLCNRSSSTMWLGCPPPRRKEWHKTPEQKHATWCSDSSSLPSLLLLSLNCSYQAVGGYPIGSLRVVAVPSHLFIFLPVSQPSLSYPRGECVPCQFY